MMRALITLTAFVWCLPHAAGAQAQPPRVVEAVDLTRYAGRWFEAARFPNKLQSQCVGDVVAHYALRPDGRIDVINRCRTADGKVNEARGLGRKAGAGTSSARLEVRFAPPMVSLFRNAWAPYWIIGLGPDYTWAVVGSPNRESLWVLSRAPKMSTASYERAIEIARGNGFDASKLVRTDNKAQ